MSATVPLGAPIQATLGTTLTRLVVADGVRQVQVSSLSLPFYVVFDNSLDDAGSVPATARHLLPAGVWPINVGSARILLAGVAGGAPVVTLLGGCAGAFGAGVGVAGSAGLTLGQVVGLVRSLFY
jgi:hypothetical protein